MGVAETGAQGMIAGWATCVGDTHTPAPPGTRARQDLWGPESPAQVLGNQRLTGARPQLTGMDLGAARRSETFGSKRNSALFFLEEQQAERCRLWVRRVPSACYNNPLCFTAVIGTV